MERLLDATPWIIGGILLVCVGGIAYAVYDDVTADKFSLRKDQWVCGKSHNEQSVTWAGKVPIYTNKEVCDLWVRI